MMNVLTLYAITCAIFLAADAVMLTLVMQPLFQHHLGDWLRVPMRFGAAAGFYLAYVAGLIWLVSWPAFRAGQPGMALLNGAVLGAVAYGTYEFTNYATLSRWSVQMVAADLIWGTLLTGTSAWAGVGVLRAFARAPGS
jgi:uncharacterized membrane protein